MPTGMRPNKPGKAAPVTPIRRVTKIDAGVASFGKLAETGKTMSEASKVLTDAHDVLTDRTSSRVQKRKATEELTAVSQYLKQSSSDIDQNLKKLAPFPGFDNRALAIIAKVNKENSPTDLQIPSTPIEKVKAMVHDYSSQTAKKKSAPSATAAINSTATQANAIIPPPINGSMYDRREIIVLITSFKKNSKARGKLIREILEQKLVPLGRSGLFRVIKQFEDHVEDGGTIDTFSNDPWYVKKGNQPFISAQSVQEIVGEIAAHPRRSFSQKQITNMMKEKKREELGRQGLVVLRESAIEPRNNTMRRYSRAIGGMNQSSCVKKVVYKTETRVTAEGSKRSTGAFAATCVFSQFLVTETLCPSVAKYLRNEATESERFAYDVVSNCLDGAPLKPVRASLLISMDDTGEYAVEGLNKDAASEVFITSVGTHDANTGVKSVFTTSPAPAVANGIRVKMTNLMTAAGTTGPVWMSVTGLNERELPKSENPAGILVLSIAGLCVGGGGVTVGRENSGFVVFVRNDGDKETDKVRYRHFIDDCLLPWIDEIRVEEGWKRGTPIPDDLTAVAWCDGDIAQLATIADESTLSKYRDRKVHPYKQSAARSAAEQAADLSPKFKLEKAVGKATTSKNIPAAAHRFKSRICNTFEQARLENGLRLPDRKVKALIDYISKHPGVLAKVVTTHIIAAGFSENGMVSKPFGADGLAYPDFDGLLGTCSKTMKSDDIDFMKSHFPRLVTEVIDHGHVGETVFDELDFPMDLDSLGQEIPKHQGISQEFRQRAKCLDHDHQVQLRAAKILQANAKQDNLYQKECKRYTDLVDTNEACEKKLNEALQLAKLNMPHATLALFDGPTKAELQAFVHVRSFPTVNKTKDWPSELAAGWPPKKGKSTDPIVPESDKCLVLLAYECRTKPIIIEKPKEKSIIVSKPMSARHLGAIIVTSTQSRFIANSYILASTLMETEAWMNMASELFGLNMNNITINQALLAKADFLQSRLVPRLEWLVDGSQRVKDHNKNNWCWNFQAKRLGHVSALFAVADIIVQDLGCLDMTDNLLADPSKFRLVTIHMRVDGAYFYWDKNRRQWVRAGMVASSSVSPGRYMYQRDVEHKNGAKLTTTEARKSEFYSSYPLLGDADPLSFGGGRQGFFENLEQYVGLGVTLPAAGPSFGAKLDEQTAQLVRLFDVTQAESEKIKTMNSKLTHVENKRRAIHYMLECACGLLLAPSCNISSNPGWEQALKQYN
ncbi:hypothetical protein SEMRO_936_G222121.1 [Seminavis robusta]|uniref:Uncharacterized protein n=1 Tax=Seminavis robusta TaxID=568900 RepID=A0A9N8EDL9_9STRA|nr:hypothetical protein SEMRO_936_G222121.1 [Seminavis robusta]|eukprot:Sro936_g222121.1  (1236) ;mRNA; r:33912-37619